MRVSCIIPTYRQFDYVFETIDSALNQSYEDIELIIADDGSETFNAEEVQKHIESQKRENLKRYKIICQENNIGTVRNLNAALKVATGDIIMPIASDDMFYDDDVIQKVVDRFRKVDCDIISCSRMLCSVDMKDKIRLMPHPAYYKKLSKLNSADEQYMAMALGESYELASGASMYYKADYAKSVGFYDETYLLWEDGPFLARAMRNGISVYKAYDIISVLYRSGGISTKKKSNIPQSIKNDYCSAIKNEYLKYPERFSKSQYKAIEGRLAIMDNQDKLTLNLTLNYPRTVLSRIFVKLSKLSMRIIDRI